MNLAAGPFRWLVTALLVLWLPVCSCAADWAVRTGLELAGSGGDPGVRHCCSACPQQGAPDPESAPPRCINCGPVSAKMLPQDERPTPEFGHPGGWNASAVEWPIVLAAARSISAGHAWRPPPATLIGLGCALVI